MDKQQRVLRPRERDSIIQSLKAGVTPFIGLQHIQVGRVHEVKALVEDIERIIVGGAAFRLIIGEYGSGKSFFLQLIRAIALEKGLVTVNADLSPDHRLHASAGQARKLYTELMQKLSTRTKPDGNAMASIVERFVTESCKQAAEEEISVEQMIQQRLGQLAELSGGYDFAKVIAAYWRGHNEDNEQLKADAVRWLRAEFSTKTEARSALGVRVIIDDNSIYDHLKLMSLFVRLAGYQGLLVNLDEMVNLYKLNNAKARSANYEQILRMLNDCLQGATGYLGFLLGGTPEFLFDERKGLYSYAALQSRLAGNSFAKLAGVIDYSTPVLQLSNLMPEELLILLKNLRHVFALGDADQYLVPDEALMAFLAHCSKQIGDAYFRTPRNTIKSFIDMLSVLEQNPGLSWEALVQKVEIQEEQSSGMPEVVDNGGGNVEEDTLVEFQL